MNFVQVITLPSPRRPPLVLCAGDEGTPSPHQLKGATIPMNASTRRKYLYQEKHVTFTSRTRPQTTLKHNYI